MISETNKYRLGDKVKLNIGGPIMSVQHCTEKIYICRWFVNGVAKIGEFAEEGLEPAESSPTRIVCRNRQSPAGLAHNKASKYELSKNVVRVALQEFGNTTAPPPDGWIRTVRNALMMTGKQLAGKLGVTKGRVYKVEQDELTGGVTLKTMKSMAEALDCRFVYAVIPNSNVDLILSEIGRVQKQ